MDSSANHNETLLWACKHGDFEKVKQAHASGADLKTVNSTNLTPLMLASNGGYLEIVKYLISKGVDVNQKNEGNGSALMLAVLNNHEEVVVALLSAGAQTNIPNKNGNTPIFAAAYRGYIRILSLLIQHGADINGCNNNGTTPLMETLSSKRIEALDMVIQAGANIYLKNHHGETALKIAVLKPTDYEVVFRLLSLMSSDEYHLIKQQESANQLVVEEAPKKKRRSRSDGFFKAMSVGLSKMTFGLINPISLQEVKDNNNQAKKSSYFELYHKQVLSYQKDIVAMLGTLAPLQERQKSFLDLPADAIFLILSNCYPEWYHYRLKRDISFIKDIIYQTIEKRTPPPSHTLDAACSSLTFQFSHMRLSSCIEENEGLIREEKLSHSEKSANRIS